MSCSPRRPRRRLATRPPRSCWWAIKRGQDGAGLSPGPRRVQGAGLDPRPAVLGFRRLGKPHGRARCEAILWDFAGQPDYRLVHALFVDDADLALVLFDAADLRDPLHGVGFWLKQLQRDSRRAGERGKSRRCLRMHPGGRQTDRGTSTLTPEELEAFCHRHGIAGHIGTSA